MKMTVTRYRSRLRDLVRTEIARTVATDDEIDDEIRRSFCLLSLASLFFPTGPSGPACRWGGGASAHFSIARRVSRVFQHSEVFPTQTL